MNADENLNEIIILNLQNVIVNNKTYHGLNSFYKSSAAKQSIDFTIIKPFTSKSNNISNDELSTQRQLTYSFPMHPFSALWKHQHQDVFKG